MLFNSYMFVFVFFPICLFGYYGLLKSGKPEAARVFLTAMSFWFYGYFNLSYLLIMVLSIAGNYLFHRLLSQKKLWGGARKQEDTAEQGYAAGRRAAAAQRAGKKTAGYGAVSRRTVMVLAVALNLCVLFYFKYFDFFLDTVNGVAGTDFVLRGILLPLGISFFTFQQISFIVDTYRGEVADCSLSEYALFVSFFPQLIAGPIVNHSEMLPQFRVFGEKKADWERIAGGPALLLLGLAKKALLADTLGAGVDYGYENLAYLGRADACLVILFYALQLYFDFSGYCDMAVGIGRMLGVEIPVNFNSPYKATNIVDFWKRWHITLNRFEICLYSSGRQPQRGGTDVPELFDCLFPKRALARGGLSFYRLGDAARSAVCSDAVLAGTCQTPAGAETCRNTVNRDDGREAEDDACG